MPANPGLDLSTLRRAVTSRAAAFRVATRLQPAGGPGDKVFPPTFAVERAPTRYATEKRRIGGEAVECVLLDSVASQANRMEAALQAAWERGDIPLPMISVDFASQGLPEIDRVTSLQAPHRIADALLRDSYYEGTLFRFSQPGLALTESSTGNAGPLYRWCPTALVFGVWDSTGPRGGLGSKFPRALVSEVIGVGAEPGVKSASRIDPTGIEIKASTLWTAKDPNEMWTLDKGETGKKYGKSKAESGKPSAANHGNIAPSIDTAAGGVTIDYALQTTVLSLTALRRLRFPVDGSGEPVQRDRQDEIEAAGHTALAALGLTAIAAARDEGYFFRSRCHLVPETPLTVELVDRDGLTAGNYDLSLAAASSLLKSAVGAAEEAGLAWESSETVLIPAPKLVELVRRSRELVATGEMDEDEA